MCHLSKNKSCKLECFYFLDRIKRLIIKIGYDNVIYRTPGNLSARKKIKYLGNFFNQIEQFVFLMKEKYLKFYLILKVSTSTVRKCHYSY